MLEPPPGNGQSAAPFAATTNCSKMASSAQENSPGDGCTLSGTGDTEGDESGVQRGRCSMGAVYHQTEYGRI